MDLILRALEPDDVDALYRWENEADVTESGLYRAPMSRELLMDYARNYNPDVFAAGQLRLIIEDRATGDRVGAIDLYEVDSINRRAGVGIIIDRKYRGNGLGKVGLMNFITHCYKHFGLHQLWAVVTIKNKISARLFESVGFKITGRLRSWVRIGESYDDAMFYQLILTRDIIQK
ncbi:MAG: GNAT family N-acetyltransferase [Paramuribaculum sp.]|nr:GNAT family N-acetyltransferase [Paramuribaculum sp.]